MITVGTPPVGEDQREVLLDGVEATDQGGRDEDGRHPWAGRGLDEPCAERRKVAEVGAEVGGIGVVRAGVARGLRQPGRGDRGGEASADAHPSDQREPAGRVQNGGGEGGRELPDQLGRGNPAVDAGVLLLGADRG